jgi:hypothetical protein
MAAHGHTGLPSQIGGAQPFPMPPSAQLPGMNTASSNTGGSDRQVAQSAEQHLLAAASSVHDPQLKAVFSTALAALHKYLVMDQKEHQQALAGKLSPRIMANAHGLK